jgi:membrane-bound serine protease (ClpP class)
MINLTSKINKYMLGIMAILVLSSLDTANVETSDSIVPRVEEESIGPLVFKFDIKQDIVPSAWRLTKRAFEKAEELNADYIIIHMNTYGGMVNIADSIRTRILNSTIPVFVYIDNNAASAGALISIACDSIYMRQGANIGAATVVNQSGEVAPDKYQSYMRSTMRSTAESHGKDTIITATDTIFKWHRDPKIAEAMVDPSVEIEGIIDEGKVLTFTAEEAVEYGFSEGIAENIQEVLDLAGIKEATIETYKVTRAEKAAYWLMNPVLQGILIMVIIGGIYFELQTPGVGFPIGAAAIAAILYFAPLYLEGMAENWELLVFVLGIILVAVEIFVIPGFGIAGIAGGIAILTGLTFAMIDNMVFEFDFELGLTLLMRSLLLVLGSFFVSLIFMLFLSKQVVKYPNLRLALNRTQDASEGFIAIDVKQKELIGRTGEAYTVLRPTGKIMIDDEIYDAAAEVGYIEKGTKVKVIRDETSQLFVIKA